MSEIIFRRINECEIPRILEIQTAAFCGEQGIPEEAIAEFLNDDPICWCAELDGQICATVAAWDEGERYHFGRFVVIPEMRGQHIATKLAKFAFDDMFENGVETIYMEARDITVRIVLAMGGKIIGEPWPFFKGNVTPLLLKKDEYFAAVKK